jgi:predicted TIM-barrel fold metal-dependent hydrolase
LQSGQIFVTCEPDESTLEAVVQLCGEDVLLYASDYPHWDSTFDSVNAIRTRAGLSESAREKILSGNARRLFGPFVQAPVIG